MTMTVPTIKISDKKNSDKEDATKEAIQLCHIIGIGYP